ncbi:glycoside hydrolase family 75 protein [Vibrio ruber]|uniref:glycoside hydrolase family 75 protein n=1 Tax=Vibrio ruber TaxID=184755 RepID=UPI0028932445|nr:glycoside hydrolase family 75 protein [Vibrio ruber]WNJ97196.1 glycoside hydrolase family 75 protein [Vibrio ruber]
MRIYLITGLLLSSITVQAAPSCSFQEWDKYQDSQLLRQAVKGPYIFATSNVKVDADGAPNAYHPDDVGLHCTKGVGFKGLDCPANGGYPNQSWWRSAIVPDPKNNSKGYIQPDGRFKGYFVSQTSLKDKSKSNLDPAKYVDSTAVPYLVFPGQFYSKTGTGFVGDYGFALNLDNGKSSSFIVAEVGPPKAHLGEMSIYLGSTLGGSDPNPRTGAGTPKGKILYVVFPYTKAASGWPIANETIESTVSELLKSIGGVEMLKSCASAL